LMLIRPDGEIAMVNRAMRELLGYETSQLVGRPMGDVFADEQYRDRWNELLRTGAMAEHPVSLRRGDGDSIPARAASVVMFHADGTPRMVVKRVAAS
jgi:PAS domain S-box-containing protein